MTHDPFYRPTLAELKAAYEQGQRDAEQGWILGASLWDLTDTERRTAYYLGTAAPRTVERSAER